MSSQLRDVLVVGFGAVGAVYSLVLKRSGRVRVTAIARGNYEAVSAQGMHFKSKKYGDIPGWRPDRLFNSVESAADRPYSYVLVSTKALPELSPTSKILSPLLTPSYTETHKQPVYVLLQNGLNVEKDLYEAASQVGKGDPKIVNTALWIGSNLLSETVCQHNDFDRLSIGIHRPGNYTDTSVPAEDRAILDDLASILESGGTTITIVPEIQRVKFTKNFWNVAFSSFATLTRYPLPAVFRDTTIAERVVPTIRAILLELLSVGRARGFDETALPSDVVDKCIEGTRRLHIQPDSKHKPSMLLDLELGKPLEVEVIFGEVVRTARALNVDIPRIETLYALLLVIQGQLCSQD